MSGKSNKEEIKSKTHAERNAEYFVALEKWMDNVRSMALTCNMFSAFPFPIVPPNPTTPPMMFAYNHPYPTPNNNNPQITVVEYRIPLLWKRFVAELIDFFILFFMKLVITFIAVDFFDFIDIEKFDMTLLQGDEKLDYKVALEMTSDILLLEFIHRIIVCFYEVNYVNIFSLDFSLLLRFINITTISFLLNPKSIRFADMQLFRKCLHCIKKIV